MKLNNMKSFFVATALLAVFCAGPNAIGATIASWNFESPNPPDSTGATSSTVAASTGTGSLLGVHASSASAWTTPAGNGSTDSYSVNNWAVNDYWQFSTSTAGSSDIAIGWDQTSSATGPRDFKVQYSTNGTTFTDVPYSYSVNVNGSPNVAWNATTSSPIYTSFLPLSSITALNNQATVYFRLVNTSTISTNGGTVATAGTDRIDNVMVQNNVPEPSSLFLALVIAGSVGAFRRRKT